jgi:membrane associated rhomboid family serine protease
MNRIFGDLPPVVKNLIIINAVMLLVMYAVKAMSGVDLNAILGLYFPKSDSFRSWQIVTHMFMHGSFIHLFLNMFALWMFGKVLEQVWGPKRFLIFYLVTGLGAAFTFELVQWMRTTRSWPPFRLNSFNMSMTAAATFSPRAKISRIYRWAS